jgi:phosphoserine phosphatase
MDPLTIPLRPLCVDMDGTLLETDTMTEMIIAFLHVHPWRSWELLLWLLRGRACFKRRLADEAVLRVELLPAHEEFVKYLVEQAAAGRTLVLVSAADESTVRRVAARFKIFSSAIGSDGKTNLRGEAKLQRLNELYGPKNFDYAGNSSVDIPVWRGAAEAIVVNARRRVEEDAKRVATVVRVFPPRAGKWTLFREVLRRQSRKF